MTTQQQRIDAALRQVEEDIAELARHNDLLKAFRVPSDWCYACGYRYMIWPTGACRHGRCLFGSDWVRRAA